MWPAGPLSCFIYQSAAVVNVSHSHSAAVVNVSHSHSAGMGLRVAQDEMVLGHHRDWNEEFQVAREIPTDTPAMKAFRDKTLFKV